MFKFGTIGAYKNVINNPRVIATQDTKIGQAFKVTNNYASNGSSSKVEITVDAGVIANGTVTFDIGGQRVYTTIVAATQTTADLAAALIKTNIDAVLLGLGYTVAISGAKITVTSPAKSSNLTDVTVDGFNATTTTLTFANVYTAGTAETSYEEAAVPFADADDVKTGDVWVCGNIIDTPNLLNSDDFVVKEGSPIRAFQLDSIKGLSVEISSDLVTTTYATVDDGDFLVPVAAGVGQMNWVKTVTTGHAIGLVVMEKTTFGGTGFYCKVASN